MTKFNFHSCNYVFVAVSIWICSGLLSNILYSPLVKFIKGELRVKAWVCRNEIVFLRKCHVFPINFDLRVKMKNRKVIKVSTFNKEFSSWLNMTRQKYVFEIFCGNVSMFFKDFHFFKLFLFTRPFYNPGYTVTSTIGILRHVTTIFSLMK